jgi:hypothetical protein
MYKLIQSPIFKRSDNLINQTGLGSADACIFLQNRKNLIPTDWLFAFNSFILFFLFPLMLHKRIEVLVMEGRYLIGTGFEIQSQSIIQLESQFIYDLL